MVNTKRIYKLNLQVFLVATILLFSLPNSVVAGDIVPNTFVTGDIVSASKMNANFNALEYYILESVDFLTIAIREEAFSANHTDWTTSELATATCLSNELLVGANCSSHHDDFTSETTNWGFVGQCRVTQTAVFGWSAVDVGLYDTWKFGPPITVQAICVSATEMSGRTVVSSKGIDEPEPTLSEEDIIAIENMGNQMLQYQQMLEEKVAE